MAKTLGRRVRTFLHIETAGGIVLLLATAAALIWANSPFADSYDTFWHTKLTLISFNDFALTEDLGHWVNDGLMAIFFFVVGLEIKSELVAGELRDPRKAAVPVIAALGGMIVPAGLFMVVNLGGDGFDGWGIPMATDIAFALGVLALLGPKIPSSLKVFLLTLAIADDIGAIAVIAIFYTSDLSLGWLAIAVGLIGVIIFMRIGRVWYIPLYVAVGSGVWLATLESGIHATIAGVALGVITPAVALRPGTTETQVDPETSVDEVRSVIFDVRETVSVTDRLQAVLHPFSSFLILPLFALANAGIEISSDGVRDASTSPVTIGVILGLVVGKTVGVAVATWIATAIGIGDLPDGVRWRDVVGVGALAGIGFTVAIFIAGLAYTDEAVIEEAKLGILVASFLAAVVGALILRRPATENAEATEDVDHVDQT
ncbi:Na+/H+ antiporter NhaA [Actinospongicola halichondriae]|uniref:Na+/H+ antiporter NhaA n=1 Tax=Actinospongicola halichondriae TaxID=3236844 RepID=UPI003D3EBF00